MQISSKLDLQEGGSVFSTIEDFMWFMACLVRSASSISPTAGPSIRNSSGKPAYPELFLSYIESDEKDENAAIKRMDTV